MASRPTVVAFNVIETLFSLDAVRHRLRDAGLPSSSLELWFARTLRSGFALTLSGDYQPFPRVAQSELESLLAQYFIEPTSTRIRSIMQGFTELEAQTDAESALRALKDAGMRIITLTNGSADITQGYFDRSGLGMYVERIYSIDEVRHWKPHPALYQYATAEAGVQPRQIAVVAVHAWDIMGAHRAGFITGWASRLEARFAPAMGQPDISGSSLIEVVEAILALPAYES